MKSTLDIEDEASWHVAMDDDELPNRLTDEQVIELMRQHPERALRVWKLGMDQWADPSSIGLEAFLPEPRAPIPVQHGLPEGEQDLALAFDKNKAVLALQVVMLWTVLVVLALVAPGEGLKPENAVKWAQFWLTILTWLGWQTLLCGLGCLIRLERETGQRANWREAWKYLSQQFLPVAYGPMVFNAILCLVVVLTINQATALVRHEDLGPRLAALSTIPLFLILLTTSFLGLFISQIPLVMGLDRCDAFTAARQIYQSALTKPVRVILFFPLRQALPAIFYTTLMLSMVLNCLSTIHAGLSGGTLLLLLPKGWVTLSSAASLGISPYLISILTLNYGSACFLFVYLGSCFARTYKAASQSSHHFTHGLEPQIRRAGQEPLEPALQNANRMAATHD